MKRERWGENRDGEKRERGMVN